MAINTDSFQAQDVSWGPVPGNRAGLKTLPPCLAFRLIPKDGLAAYPRNVQLQGGGVGSLSIADASWQRVPRVSALTLAPAVMPLAAVWAALSSGDAGFDRTNPPYEDWWIQYASEEDDLLAPAMQPPASQILWTVDAPAPAPTHKFAGPIFDTAPWRSVLVSILTTDETAEFDISGFMDVAAAGSAIDAGLVLGNLTGMGSYALVSGSCAPSQPSQAAVLFTNDQTAAGASTMKIATERLLPFLFGWHVGFGTHRRRVTFRGYR